MKRTERKSEKIMNKRKKAWLYRESTVVLKKEQARGSTSEEFREIVFYEPVLKPSSLKERKDFNYDTICLLGICPVCKNGIDSSHLYCKHCGIAVDWSVDWSVEE